MMISKFHSGLSKDLSLILNDADDFNVIIKVGENQEFRAHSVILRARSLYFKNVFSNELITNENNIIIFNKPNIVPKVFEMILRYIYAGEIDLTEHLCEHILGLLVASEELLLDELFNHVENYLVENQTIWIQQNLVLVLHTVFKLTNCKKLQDYCLECVCADPKPFIISRNFPLLDKDILYGLLERDDLQIEEVIVWDCLIKWGIEQTPGLGNGLGSKNSDRSKWSNENYESLKKTLEGFIPLIRFVDISSIDYFDKVRPYKAVIPNHIYEEIEEYYFKGTLPKVTTLPPRTGMIPNFESKIIKPKLSNIIINWINGKDSYAIHNKKDSCNFNLIYRMSRDGKNTIQNRCIGQGAIIILIKVKNSEKIFGGYNPIGWINRNNNNNNNTYNRPFNFRQELPNHQYLSTTESFIFSFENSDDNKNMKISRVINSSYAIYDYSGMKCSAPYASSLFEFDYSNSSGMNGISFGKGDLKLENGYLSLSYSGYYENNLNTNGEGYKNKNGYKVEEIEAFSVRTF